MNGLTEQDKSIQQDIGNYSDYLDTIDSLTETQKTNYLYDYVKGWALWQARQINLQSSLTTKE